MSRSIVFITTTQHETVEVCSFKALATTDLHCELYEITCYTSEPCYLKALYGMLIITDVITSIPRFSFHSLAPTCVTDLRNVAANVKGD